MPWFTVDDAFHSDDKTSKVLAAGAVGREAIGLWALAGSWCMQQLTDGFVPSYKVTQLGFKPKHAAALVDSGVDGKPGLWVAVEGGYRFHNWLKRNPSREKVLANRVKTNERVQRHRHDTPRNGVSPPSSNGVARSSRNGVTNAGETRLPDPRSQIPKDQRRNRVEDLNADHRARAKPGDSRLVFDPDSARREEQTTPLLEGFERIVHAGKRVADRDRCLSLLGDMLPALVDRAPADPIGLFERVLTAYTADRRARSKTPTVELFVRDFAAWAQTDLERAPATRAKRVDELLAELEDVREKKRNATTDEARAEAGIAESRIESALVSLGVTP